MSARRVLDLDVVRGFALLGILFGNLTWFTGTAVLSPEERAATGTTALDTAVTWGIHAAVDGKFYGIFSLLFGAGFAILAGRLRERGEPVRTVLLRRLGVLLLLGLTHAVLLWFGDIVSLYAVVGLALLLFLESPGRRLLFCAGAFFLVPVVVAAVWLVLPAGEAGYGPGALLPAFGQGTYAEAFEANWAFLRERWFLALYSGRPFKLLGLFLVGFWAGRSGLALAPGEHLPLLRRVRAWGLGIGLPTNLLLAFLITTVPDRPPTLAALLRAATDAVAVPTLALGYVATLLLLLRNEAWRRRLAWMAFPGRMTLTNYVGQTILGMIVFYGCGFGVWGSFGAVWIVPLATGIFLFQAACSAFWLSRFRQGPLEWGWRVLASRRPSASVRVSPGVARSSRFLRS